MNRRELLAIVIVCLVAGVIRCVGLLEPSIWFDEAMSGGLRRCRGTPCCAASDATRIRHCTLWC